MGRPTKLTPAIQRKLCAALRLGNYLETAAAMCGISASTLRLWMRRGERSSDGIHHEFLAAVEKALAEGEVRSLAVIREAAKVQWQAAAWMLERRFPERWAMATRIAAETEKRAAEMISSLEGRLPDAVYRQVLRALAGVGIEASSGAPRRDGEPRGREAPPNS